MIGGCNKLKERGGTIAYIPWDDMEGKPKVVSRFKQQKRKMPF